MQAFTYHEPIGVCGQISPWSATACCTTLPGGICALPCPALTASATSLHNAIPRSRAVPSNAVHVWQELHSTDAHLEDCALHGLRLRLCAEGKACAHCAPGTFLCRQASCAPDLPAASCRAFGLFKQGISQGASSGCLLHRWQSRRPSQACALQSWPQRLASHQVRPQDAATSCWTCQVQGDQDISRSVCTQACSMC